MVFNMFAVREKAMLRCIVVRQRLSPGYLENTVTVIPITPRSEEYQPLAFSLTILITILDIVAIFSRGLYQILRVGIGVALAVTQFLHFSIQTQTNPQILELVSLFQKEVNGKRATENVMQTETNTEPLIKHLISHQQKSEKLETVWMILLLLRLVLLQWFIPKRLTFIITNFRNATIITIPFLIRLGIPIFIFAGGLHCYMGYRSREVSTYTRAVTFCWRFLLGDFVFQDFHNSELLFVFLTFILYVIITQFIIAQFLSVTNIAEEIYVPPEDKTDNTTIDKR